MTSQMWETLAASTSGQNLPEDFEAAAYRLVVEQVLYHADRNSRVAYWLVERFERNFRQALAPLGIDISVNRQLRYAFAIPQHGKAGSASVGETVLALVLRAIYDENARQGRITDDSEVVIDLVELDEKYRLLSGREIPLRARLDALLDTMKRWGIARKSEEIDNAGVETRGRFSIAIRPAIVDLLGDSALARLGLFRESVSPASTPGEDETAADATGGEPVDGASSREGTA